MDWYANNGTWCFFRISESNDCCGIFLSLDLTSTITKAINWQSWNVLKKYITFSKHTHAFVQKKTFETIFNHLFKGHIFWLWWGNKKMKIITIEWLASQQHVATFLFPQVRQYNQPANPEACAGPVGSRYMTSESLHPLRFRSASTFLLPPTSFAGAFLP